MNFICEFHEQAWNSALDLLKPTPAQLDHGLELHRDLFCMDHFGFLPHGCWNHTIVSKWDEFKERNVGPKVLGAYPCSPGLPEACPVSTSFPFHLF